MYKTLFDAVSPDRIVKAGIIGTGHFATAIVTQSVSIPRLHIPVVADINVQAGVNAFKQAGIHEDEIAICESATDIKQAWDKDKRIVIPDASLMMDQEIDIVVEATGIPEAGARYGLEAIEHGKHLAMVSKDVDIVVGPILKHMADKAGVVYTQVDGDQHGLLVQLVEWARELGLEIISAGKFLEFDLILDPEDQSVSWGQESKELDSTELDVFNPSKGKALIDAYLSRREILDSLGTHKGYDVVEMALAANVADLSPDTPALHGPPIRINEIADLLCDEARGGILQSTGVVDCVSCLRQPFEASMGGGVFAVVDTGSDYSRHIMHTKGMPPNTFGNAGLIFKPYHLCGVETALSLLSAVLLKQPTSGKHLKPIYDVVAEARVDLKSGDPMGSDKSPDLKAFMIPSTPSSKNAPIPLHLARGNSLIHNKPLGSIISYKDILPPKHSVLWNLRREQDQLFHPSMNCER